MSGWSCTGKRWLFSCASCVHPNPMNRDEVAGNNLININNNQEKSATPLISHKFIEEKIASTEELIVAPDIADDPPISNGVKSRVLSTKSNRSSAPGTPIALQKTSTPISNDRPEVGRSSEYLVGEAALFNRNSLASTASSITSRTTSEGDVFFPQEAEEDCVDMSIRSMKSPQFTLKPQSKVVEEGKSVTFKCAVTATPAPTVDWYKGAVKQRGSDRVKVENLPSGESQLEIEDLRATDAGTYRCVANNCAGKASCSVELILTAKESAAQMAQDRPPAFSQTLRPAEVKVGNRVRFECKVEGRPKPTVVWNKDGKVVSASSRVRIMEVYGTHSLVISRTEATDNGVYSITASNHVGSDTCSAQLQVQDAATPRGSSSSQHSAYAMSSDRSSPNTSNLSSPSLSPKLGRSLASSRPVSGNASPWASGIKTGGGGPPPRRRGPGFILRPRPQTSEAGERLCLKCTLLGNPKPTVTWEKDGELVDEERTDGHIHTRNEGNDYFLEIEESRPEDAGKYTVSARNSLGKQTASVEVTISGASPSGKAPAKKSAPASARSNHVTNDTQSDALPNSRNISSAAPSGGEEEKRPSRVGELILPSGAKPDDSKDSPTGSISSTVSSHSRMSTSSSRSNASAKHDHEAEESAETTSYKKSSTASWRRSNYVAPTFTRRLSSTQVLEGEELLLQCEVSGEPEPELRWMRNGIEVGIDEDEVFTSFRNGIARLRLRDLQASHAGEYICKARNEAGVIQCSSRVTVKAKPVVTRPRFARNLSDVRVTEGETLTLEAEVDGSPTPEILWSLDGEEISSGECSFNKNIAKLTVHNMTQARSGQYMCNALNSGGEDSVACRVRVKQKKSEIAPEFTAGLSDVKVAENDDVCLRCMVTGIPEPTVKWMYNQEMLEAEDGIEITYQHGVAALTLEQATDEDTGTYTCVAENVEGQTRTSCKVTVEVAKKPEKKSAPAVAPKFVNPFDEYIRTQEGDTLNFEFTMSGSPQPTVKWTANDQPLENATTEIDGDKVKMVISPVLSTHSGHVKCTLQNSAGSVSHEARIYVRSKRVAPSFETDLPATIEVLEGAEASFECRVTGHPQPRVTWTRDGRSLSILTTETTYEDGVAAVRIRKAGPREGGKYICTARNLSGEAQSVCTVKVAQKAKEEAPKKPSKSAPTFSKQLADQRLDDGQDLKLVCNVSGNPTPEITWFVDGQRLEAEDGDASYKDGVAMMVLEDAMQEDSGIYKCVAKNDAGSAESSCKVSVKGPAKKEPEKVEESDPSFPITLEDKTIKEGEDIVLNCKVVGVPRPKIKWLLDGEEIQDAEIKYADDGNIELVLPEALPEDEGVYTCIAENPLKRVMSSCTVTIEVPPKQSKKKMQASQAKQQEEAPAKPEKPSPKKSDSPVKPAFVDGLSNVTVADGTTNFKLTCKVEGNPPPTARWFMDDEEKVADEDFQIVANGDERSLVFAEVFPDDTGVYTCVISNSAGEATSKCTVSVEEIDGVAPSFVMKPKQVNVNGGERALFNCRVDGDPQPTVQWLFCNRPIEDAERYNVTVADQSNNYTHSLEIPIVSPQDAGRYSACCSNLLGDVTCTVSLIVSDAKRQESRTDFRGVLKKSANPKSPTSPKSGSDDQVDFRSVLRSTSADKDLGRKGESTGSEEAGEDPGMIYKEALTTTVKTKALTEEERKAKKAEQKDFRSNLVRKVVSPELAETKQEMRSRGPEQKDFREEALKTKVQTKALGQDDYRIMHGEQKDFRSETIKSKVTTKSYNEDVVKAKRAEQKDFRNVLSPTKRDAEDSKPKDATQGGSLNLAELPKAKWKKDTSVDHNTVATKRSRHRAVVPERKINQNGDEAQEEEEEEPVGRKPEFTQAMTDVEIKDGQPFQLVCHVTGEPRPEITWFLEDEEVKAEADIAITFEGDECRLSVAESLAEDQGRYSCTARNDHGQTTCSCYVTVLTDEPPQETSQHGLSQFAKKKSSLTSSSAKPAEITDGPRDCTVVKGNPISLCCALAGTPPLKVVWRKGRDEIRHSSQCNIESTRSLSALTIAKSERDDSGCYTLQVTNQSGVDQFSVSVKVVDIPDPPGKPFAQSATGDDIVVSWYGSGYDGGSSIKSYMLEVCKVWDNNSGNKVWNVVASTNSTSHTVKGLEKNATYIFRVSAENMYGVSKPGPASDVVRNLPAAMENGADSSEDEEDESTFVKYEPVKIRQNQKFSTKYEIHEKLGQGRFGKVHRVTDRETGKHYAAKIMRALKVKDKEAVSLEIEIMNKLRHPKLVQLIDAFSSGREITMVMDLVAGGELFERVIDEDFILTEAACIKYMRQICAGVQFMHNSNIVHLDLKPENIMCINKTGTQIKLIDFGLARKFNATDTVRVMFGTPEFVAPEVINYDAIGFQTDMWSVGVICYILLSGLSPFSGDADSETLSNITAVKWDFEDEAFDQISDEAKDFISHLLVKSLKNRYTVDKALQHRWLKNDVKKMSKSQLNTKNLKRFLARRKWQKTGNAVRALGRLASLARLPTSTSGATNGQRESGFLSALKAQLVREKESGESQEKRKPEFVRTFDDVEVVAGSAAKFECTITGSPDPEIAWYIDGKPIKESRHFRISYTEDDVCTLLITEAGPQDEAEFTCKAMNSEGAVEHSAELIVITPVKRSSSTSSTSSSSSSTHLLCQSPLSSSSNSSLENVCRNEDVARECFKLGEPVFLSFEMHAPESEKNLSCVIEEEPTVRWFKLEEKDLQNVPMEKEARNKEIVPNSNCTVKSFPCLGNSDQVASSIMVLHSLATEDNGFYVCTCEWKDWKTSKKYQILIADEETIHQKTTCLPPRFVKVSRNQTVPEGSDAVLKCIALGKPAPLIYWYMYGTKLYQGERHRFAAEGTDGTLSVLATRWYDSGKYECHAVSPLGRATCTVDLCVQPADHQEVEFEGAPMFLLRTESKIVQVGSNITFKCTIAGTPTPKVYWKRGDHVISARESSRFVFTQSPGGAYSLTVKKVRLIDDGKYTCVAENARGVALCGAFLMAETGNGSQAFGSYDVLPLAPVFVTRPYSATVRRGYSAAFQCTVHGVPQPKLTWHLANGTKIKSDGHYTVEDLKSHHTLRIPKANETDQGFYFCTASNSAGEASCSVKLDVALRESSVPPSVKFGSEALSLNSADETSEPLRSQQRTRSLSSTKSVTLTSGKNAKISLTVRGVPKPEVTWYKSGRQLKTGNRFSLNNTEDVHQLRIAKVRKDDAGSYSVLACNAGGLFTTLINISVREIRLPSIFAKDPEPTTAAHEGADAVIQCRLKEGLKSKEAKWWKENEPLSGKSGKYEMTSEGSLRKLTVKSVTPKDSGKYKCKVGSHTTSGKLTVHRNQDDFSMESKISINNSKTPIKILSLPTPAHMEVPERGTLILQHRLSEEVENCKWSLNGKELQESERCNITCKDGKYSLMLMNITPKDAGDVVFQVPGTKVAITTSIRVQALPPAPDTPKIEFKGDNDVRVSWKPIGNDAVDYVIEAYCEKTEEWNEVGSVAEKVGHLIASGLEPGSSYRFRMTARNEAGAGESCQPTELISIPSKTYIVQGLDDVTISEGETARFNVQLSSDSCDGNWFLNGLKLSQRGETCQLMTSGCAHSLVMRNLTKTGSATVQFVSRDGRLMTSAQLMVKGKSLSVVQNLADVTVTENAEATFTIALSKAVNKLGKWYHKGIELTQSHDVIMEKRGEFQMLHMKNIKNTASGEIRFVMPGEPQTSCAANLNVLSWFETEPFQKIVTALPESTSVRIGEDAVFVVGLSSDGRCNSTWTHCGKPVPKKSKKYKIKQHGDEIRLIIRDVTPDDVGPVQCVVDKQKTVTELGVSESAQELVDGVSDEPTGLKFKFLDGDSEATRNQVRSFSEGDRDVVITCRVSDPEAKVEWRKNGKVVDCKDNNLVNVDDKDERKLIFKKLTPEDGATYECVIKYEDQDIAKRSFDVVVRETPQRITKQLSGSEQLTEGDTMRLAVCVEPPNADLVWLKDGLKLKVSDQKGSRIRESGLGTNERCLLVEKVTCQDSGTYSCETIHDTSNIKVQVSEPVVEVVEKLQDCDCEDCGTVSFQVQLSRKPKENYLWKLKGRKLLNSEHCLITCNENVYCATLRNLAEKDSGRVEFECGGIKESASLSVSPPPLKFTKRLNDVTASSGFDAIFVCEVNEENADVQWFKDGEEIEQGGRFVIISEGRIRKLKVKKVTFEDTSASFKCKTKNDVTSCTLVVEKPVLSVVDELDDITVIEGEKATFRCKLSLADVKVVWLKNGKVLKDEKHRCEVYSEGFIHELRMRKLTIADSGEVKLAVGCDLLDSAILRVKKPPVQFTRELRDQVVDLKVAVEMFCEVSDPEADVTWYRNDATIEDAQKTTDLFITTKSEGCRRTLTISRALMHHEARYSCVTEDGNRTSAELFIKVPPLTLVRQLVDVSKYIGDDVEFVVELSVADVEGEWLLDSEPLKEGKKVSIIIADERKALRLKDVQQSGIITYRVNKHVTSTCRLDVRERPVAIERRLSDVRAREGSDVTFECYFSKPDLQVTWYVDDEELTSDEKFQIDSDGCTQRLRVRDVRYDDEANYSCRYKHRRTSAELTVLEPRVDVVKHLRDLDAYEGESRMLECELSLPVVSVSWHKDGRPIMGVDSQVVKGEDSVTHMLVLDNLSRASSGSYTLVALNKTLTSSKVQVSPKPISVVRPLPDVTIQDDQSVLNLECEFSKPCHNVVWTCNGTEITASSDVEIESVGAVQKLTIHSPQWDDSGRYCCVAPKNCETTCAVKVEQWKIKFVQNLPQTLVFHEGETSQLSVLFSDNVQPDEVTWFVDDVMVDEVFATQNKTSVQFQPNGSSLIIEKANLDWNEAAVSVTCRNVASSCVIEVIGLPRAPLCVGGTQDGLHVKLRFREPRDQSGCDIIDYVVEAKAVDEWEEADCSVTMQGGDDDIIEALVKGLRSGITYWFRVAAISQHGRGEFSEFADTFTPQEPLVFVSELEDLVVEEGETLEMWCELSRASNLDAVWTHNDESIENEDGRVSFYSYDDTREIVIEGVTPKDSGTYSCAVDNLTSSCNVTVKPQPIVFVRYLEDVTAVEGNELALSCELSASNLKVMWYKDGKELHNSPKHQLIEDNSIHMLIIDECEETDAGTYKCETRDFDSAVINTQAVVHVMTSDDDVAKECNGVSKQQTVEDDVFVSDTFDSDSLEEELLSSTTSEDSITNEMVLEEVSESPIAGDDQSTPDRFNPEIPLREKFASEPSVINDKTCHSNADKNVVAMEDIPNEADQPIFEDASHSSNKDDEELDDNNEQNSSYIDENKETGNETPCNSANESSFIEESSEDLTTTSSSETNNISGTGQDLVSKSVSFGDSEVLEKREQNDSDKKWKRMSVASVFSDAYETANESFVTDDDAFTDAVDEEESARKSQRAESSDNNVSQGESEHSIASEIPINDTIPEDSESACTVSSFNSAEMKVLSPVLEEDEFADEEKEEDGGSRECAADGIEREEDGGTNLVMDLRQLREAFLSDSIPTRTVDGPPFISNDNQTKQHELPPVFSPNAGITNETVSVQRSGSTEENTSLPKSEKSSQRSGGDSQGLVDCLHSAYDATCVIKQLAPPVEETMTTTIVVDAKTGETVTMSSKKVELVATSLVQEDTRSALEEIGLPLETTDDKLARMFGSTSSAIEEDVGEGRSNKEGETKNEVFEVVETREVKTFTAEQVLSVETVHNVPPYDEMIESCVQALETIQETSAVALWSDSEEERINNEKPQSPERPTVRQGVSPGFKEGLHNQQVIVGSTVFLQCVVAAFPDPTVQWSKEGSAEDVMRLDDSMPGINMSCVKKSEELSECTLQLDNVTLLDSGLYSCQASNSYGQSSCSAVVQVHDDGDDVIASTDNVMSEQSNSDARSGDVTPTGGPNDLYSSDDDVSISMPPPSENSWSFRVTDQWKTDETKSVYSERAVQAVVDNADKMSMASASTKPLKIHVLESIVVRETFESSDSSSDEDSDSNPPLSTPRRRKVGALYREVAVKCSSRSATAMLSDSESDSESFRSSVPPTPDVYYAVRAFGASGRDSATLQLTSGQAVEVMDVSSSREWLVRTKPNKHNPVRMGFVDPAFLAPHHFTPSPAPPRIVEENLPSAILTTEFMVHESVDSDAFEFPNDVSQFGHVIHGAEQLSTACSNPGKKLHVSNLMKEEQLYVTGLRKAIYVMRNVTAMSASVESRAQELFGDLEGLEHFHTNTMLPELASIQGSPHLLPHVFLKYHATFEQLHLSYVMNTGDSATLSRDDETIAEGLLELSLKTGFPLGEVPQATLQHLVLYQYYLKKLLHYDDTPQSSVRPIRDAIQLLADIPNKARTSKLWYRMRGRPKQSDKFGKLVKEDVVGTSNPDDTRNRGRWRFRRLFLFENCLVVAKLHKVTSRSYSDGSDFEQIYQTDSMMLELDDSGLEPRQISLKSSENGFGEALWRLKLKTKSEAGKKAWIRQLQRSIHMTMRPPLPVLPRFAVPLRDIIADINDDIVLFCYVTNKPDSGMTWRKDDCAITADEGHVSYVERDDGYCALHLRHVTERESGVYRCMTGEIGEISCSSQVHVMKKT